MSDQPKLKQERRSHLTPEQEAAFSQLRNVLDPTNQTYNPVSRRGAQIMQERGQQVHYWQSPFNVLGLTFHEDYLGEGATKDETKLLKESGLSPIAARGQIAANAMALTDPWQRPDIIPHELAHLAILADGYADGGIDEAIVRQLMIQDGLSVKDNMEFLSATIRTDAMDIVENFAKFTAEEAARKLKANTPKAKGK